MQEVDEEKGEASKRADCRNSLQLPRVSCCDNCHAEETKIDVLEEIRHGVLEPARMPAGRGLGQHLEGCQPLREAGSKLLESALLD